MAFETDFDDELEDEAPARDEFDQFLDGITAAGSTFDPTQVIKIVSTTGNSMDVPVQADHAQPDGVIGYTIDEVLTLANMAVSPATQFWVNNAQVERNFVVAAGATITAVGMVKGG